MKFQGRCFNLTNRKISVNFVFSRVRAPPAVPNIPENPNYRENSSIIHLLPKFNGAWCDGIAGVMFPGKWPEFLILLLI